MKLFLTVNCNHLIREHCFKIPQIANIIRGIIIIQSLFLETYFLRGEGLLVKGVLRYDPDRPYY